MTEIRLELPEPPSQAGRQGWKTEWRKRFNAKQAAWLAAIRQVRPFRDPPESVLIHAHFRLHTKRDPTNLYRDLKPVVDALKQTPAPADKLAWKNGFFLERGYFESDDDVDFGDVTQEIDRSDRGLSLRIEILDDEWEGDGR